MEASITIKGKSSNATRAEFEYPIPLVEADEIIETLCLEPLIEKRRYMVEHRSLTWEVDEFQAANEGLILAEVELETEEHALSKPLWLGAEVTEDARFFNVNLVNRPYKSWNGQP